MGSINGWSRWKWAPLSDLPLGVVGCLSLMPEALSVTRVTGPWPELHVTSHEL